MKLTLVIMDLVKARLVCVRSPLTLNHNRQISALVYLEFVIRGPIFTSSYLNVEVFIKFSVSCCRPRLIVSMFHHPQTICSHRRRSFDMKV